MGARVGRMLRNFNLENRALREISKEKPMVAPRHAVNVPPPAASSHVTESVKQKGEFLQVLLRSVYVESRDPAATQASKEVTVGEEVERRPLNISFPGNAFGQVELTHVPKGKLSLPEALKVLGSHQHKPQTWTPEKIAEEYSLELKDTRALLEFFIPFRMEIIPSKTGSARQIKAS
uniref:NADH dehydrogenase [ubiquinone] 1 alpha subcomplex assembly factor 4 n=1 Tax=Iconisemion striatum TaxID=60296 RepID=A0A1A7Y2L8_9TELE